MSLTIAHLSDVHLAPVRGIGIDHLNVKRALGFANWMLKRRKVHLRSAVDRLTADMATQKPDHIIVSGDLVNLGLPGEYDAALEWLATLGPPDRVSVVPGNHDVYCRLWSDPGIERWRAYMRSDIAGTILSPAVERGFPYVRHLGGDNGKIAIIGLVSAVPTRPFYASGRLGKRQLAALGPILGQLGREGFFRLVVIHHPPLPGQADQRRGLADAAALEAILQQQGAELVVHGHNHVDMAATRRWPGGTVHTIGVASASIGRAYKGEALARYNLYRIDTRGHAASTEVVTRGLSGVDGPVTEIGRRHLEIAVTPA